MEKNKLTVFFFFLNFWNLGQNLDEIQSYILVERSMEQEYGTTDSVAQELAQEFIDMVSSLRVSASFENFSVFIFSYKFRFCWINRILWRWSMS